MSTLASIRYQKYEPVVATSSFAVTFPLYSTADLAVYVDGVTVPFTVTATFANGVATDAAVNLATAVSDVDVEIVGERAARREDTITPGKPGLAPLLEAELAKITSTLQEHRREIDRSFRTNYGASGALPPAEAGKYLSWNDAETAIVNRSDDNSATTVVATGTTRARSMADRAADGYHLQDFGAIGSNATTNQATFQAALDSGELFINLPAGAAIPLNDEPLTQNVDGQHIFGRGCELQPGGGTANIIEIGDGATERERNVWQDLTIWPRGTKTAGAAILIDKASRLTFQRVRLGTLRKQAADGNRFYDGVKADAQGFGIGDLWFDGCEMIGGTHYATTFASSIDNFAEVVFDGKCAIRKGWDRAVYAGGGVGGLYLLSVDALECNFGLFVDAVLGGLRNREMICGARCVMDGSLTDGARFGANAVQYFRAIGSWFAGSGAINVNILDGQFSTAKFKFSAVHNAGAQSHGWAINDGHVILDTCETDANGRGASGGDGALITATSERGVIITGGSFTNNGVDDEGDPHDTVGSGVRIQGLSAQVAAKRVRITAADMANNARFAVDVVEHVDKFDISKNTMESNQGGAQLRNAVTLNGQRRIRENDGWVTETSGEAVIPTGATSVTFNHGMDQVPTVVNLTAKGDQDSTFYLRWVAVGLTQVTIHYGNTAGANRTIVWDAYAK